MVTVVLSILFRVNEILVQCLHSWPTVRPQLIVKSLIINDVLFESSNGRETNKFGILLLGYSKTQFIQLFNRTPRNHYIYWNILHTILFVGSCANRQTYLLMNWLNCEETVDKIIVKINTGLFPISMFDQDTLILPRHTVSSTLLRRVVSFYLI